MRDEYCEGIAQIYFDYKDKEHPKSFSDFIVLGNFIKKEIPENTFINLSKYQLGNLIDLSQSVISLMKIDKTYRTDIVKKSKNKNKNHLSSGKKIVKMLMEYPDWVFILDIDPVHFKKVRTLIEESDELIPNKIGWNTIIYPNMNKLISLLGEIGFGKRSDYLDYTYNLLNHYKIPGYTNLKHIEKMKENTLGKVFWEYAKTNETSNFEGSELE